jgi:hypothetical protein
MTLHVHVPPDTYAEHILRYLRTLEQQNASIQERSARESRLYTIRTAIYFFKYEYIRDPLPQRFEVRGDICVTNMPVSNLRIFFD